MATEKVEEVPAAEPAVEEAPKEAVEDKLADLKIDDTPAGEDTTEEEAEDPKSTQPEKVDPPEVLEVVETVDTQTPAPDATTEPATREVPTDVVHESADEPHKTTLGEKVSAFLHPST